MRKTRTSKPRAQDRALQNCEWFIGPNSKLQNRDHLHYNCLINPAMISFINPASNDNMAFSSIQLQLAPSNGLINPASTSILNSLSNFVPACTMFFITPVFTCTVKYFRQHSSSLRIDLFSRSSFDLHHEIPHKKRFFTTNQKLTLNVTGLNNKQDLENRNISEEKNSRVRKCPAQSPGP